VISGWSQPVDATVAAHQVLPHGLNFRLREQPVQKLLAAPLISAEPANEPLLAFVLETNHEESVRTIDGWRHDLELRDLCGMPHASLPITIFDRSLGPRTREWARHMS
jgi:hypothetical protein